MTEEGPTEEQVNDWNIHNDHAVPEPVDDLDLTPGEELTVAAQAYSGQIALLDMIEEDLQRMRESTQPLLERRSEALRELEKRKKALHRAAIKVDRA